MPGCRPSIPTRRRQAAFREKVAGASALLVSCPEYAHGIPGAFKNALDWLVGDGRFAGMPVALWNGSPRSVHAPAQLREVLSTMAARIVDPACVTIPVQSGAGVADLLANRAVAGELAAALGRLVEAARVRAEDTAGR
ncbi:MAG: NAD(P)H-dependent oxidoreductase [Methylobacteriaceae bacterium]|nr:NAD(P)H-dependent oxidoreductase [Methylobacteriaceae bacterium]